MQLLPAALGWARAGATGALMLPPAMLMWPLARARSRQLARQWARGTLERFGVEVRLHDRTNGRAAAGGALFVQLNQKSLSEVLVYHAAMPELRWVINLEFAIFPLGWTPWAMGGVVLRRNDRRQSLRALERVAADLARGDSFGISIEGRRTPSGELAPYKKGPAVVAIRAQADIVPFVMHGAGDVWPYGDWRVRPGVIDVELLPAIRTSGMTYQDRDALVATLRGTAEGVLG